MTPTPYLSAPTAASLATRLADLWQVEERIGYRLDAWLLRHVREVDAEAHERDASAVRRDYHGARRALREHLRSLGREVVQLPVIEADATEPTRADAAARGLQRLHRELSRSNDQLNRLSRMAILQRDRASAAALSALHEAQLDTLELVRELFAVYQEASREALRGRAA